MSDCSFVILDGVFSYAFAALISLVEWVPRCLQCKNWETASTVMMCFSLSVLWTCGRKKRTRKHDEETTEESTQQLDKNLDKLVELAAHCEKKLDKDKKKKKEKSNEHHDSERSDHERKKSKGKYKHKREKSQTPKSPERSDHRSHHESRRKHRKRTPSPSHSPEDAKSSGHHGNADDKVKSEMSARSLKSLLSDNVAETPQLAKRSRKSKAATPSRAAEKQTRPEQAAQIDKPKTREPDTYDNVEAYDIGDEGASKKQNNADDKSKYDMPKDDVAADKEDRAISKETKADEPKDEHALKPKKFKKGDKEKKIAEGIAVDRSAYKTMDDVDSDWGSVKEKKSKTGEGKIKKDAGKTKKDKAKTKQNAGSVEMETQKTTKEEGEKSKIDVEKRDGYKQKVTAEDLKENKPDTKDGEGEQQTTNLDSDQ